MKMNSKDRYWRWAGYADEAASLALLRVDVTQQPDQPIMKYEIRVAEILPFDVSINDVLLTDMLMVLPNDMLTKVD